MSREYQRVPISEDSVDMKGLRDPAAPNVEAPPSRALVVGSVLFYLVAASTSRPLHATSFSSTAANSALPLCSRREWALYLDGMHWGGGLEVEGWRERGGLRDKGRAEELS